MKWPNVQNLSLITFFLSIKIDKLIFPAFSFLQSCTTITIINPRTFHHSKKKTHH